MSSKSLKTVVFDKDTGAILSNSTISDDYMALNQHYGYVSNSVTNPTDHYIKDGRITDRPPQQTAYYKSKLFRLPTPCTIYINGTAYECTDTIAELDLVAGLKHHIRVVSFPFLDWEIEIED